MLHCSVEATRLPRCAIPGRGRSLLLPHTSWAYNQQRSNLLPLPRPPPCAQLLRKLPTASPRGLALQQFAGAVLLERLLPAHHKLAPPKSAVNRREAADPAAVVEAQPWFANGKALVAGATSGAAQVPRGGYGIGARRGGARVPRSLPGRRHGWGVLVCSPLACWLEAWSARPAHRHATGAAAAAHPRPRCAHPLSIQAPSSCCCACATCCCGRTCWRTRQVGLAECSRLSGSDSSPLCSKLPLWKHTGGAPPSRPAAPGPALLRCFAGEPSCVGAPFLQRWHEFLGTLQKHIKSMQPEDQNVKVTGCRQELRTPPAPGGGRQGAAARHCAKEAPAELPLVLPRPCDSHPHARHPCCASALGRCASILFTWLIRARHQVFLVHAFFIHADGGHRLRRGVQECSGGGAAAQPLSSGKPWEAGGRQQQAARQARAGAGSGAASMLAPLGSGGCRPMRSSSSTCPCGCRGCPAWQMDCRCAAKCDGAMAPANGSS